MERVGGVRLGNLPGFRALGLTGTRRHESNATSVKRSLQPAQNQPGHGVVPNQMNSENFRSLAPIRIGLGLVIMVMLAGCADTPTWSSLSAMPTSAQLQAARGRLSSYVYFTSYEIYFDHHGGQYTYWDGRGWVTRGEPPPGISLELLENSPSVAMDFPDAPWGHHATVVQSYPRNWGRSAPLMVSSR